VRTVAGAALVTTYGYNNAGDLASTTYSDGVTPAVGITYTRFGAQKTVTDVTGTRTFTYTAALRPDREQLDATYYGGRLLTRNYDPSGATIGRPSGFKLGLSGAPSQDYSVTYGYDPAGRMNTVTDPNGTFTYAFTANSNLRGTLTSPVHTVTTLYAPYRDEGGKRGQYFIFALKEAKGVNTLSLRLTFYIVQQPKDYYPMNLLAYGLIRHR
jgi:YD repeat-containing protein